ncbi:Myosin type-2 heavy chain 1 [Maudiozyma exigua]|uniref:Myosin type-2 heavy chain 1 n=1 Tax=Maudiozyma exigua TaxID=34358 RepID=A0A9P6WB27_MAUEX|nr:Myosin type-2 heavy chain 1 [Kazachstania exigua]
MSFEVGTRCWYPSKEHGWVAAEVANVSQLDGLYHMKLKLDDTEEIVEIDTKYSSTELEKLSSIASISTDNDSRIPEDLPVLRNPSILENTQDLTALSYLNEPAVLHAIKSRYNEKKIYTYSGIVLIANNPFDKTDDLYSPEMISKYATSKQRQDLEPHIFAIAGEAYTRMITDKINQTIVVSGESGAGKTVSAKYIMRYFASLEPQMAHDGSVKEQSRMTEIEEKILATNPILEAFGNAKTTRNDNSSRFGKYLEIMFSEQSKIVGARIRTYLLERSRLVFQPESERNYHIFYQLMMGLDSETKSKWQLNDVNDFHYMNQGSSTENGFKINGIDDFEEFNRTKDALLKIGISEEMQNDIFQILAALLHIGNIEITKTRNDASLSYDEKNLLVATELLGIDNVGFAKWIVKKQINTRSEKIISNLNFAQAMVTKDSIAKFIYSALFDMIVDKLNETLMTDNDPTTQDQVKSFIGVLDIYGFEHFERNSFEQFCINYANEKLQQEFNQHVFKLEQEEYVNEKIEWSFIEFNDNQPCIDLIENKLGILSLLDEESRLPAGSDETWAEKLYQCLDKPPTNAVFNKPRFGQTKFVVRHYANDVTYDVEGFIEKNRDTVSDGQFEVLKATSNDTLKMILDNLVKKQEKLAEEKQEHDTKPGAIFRRNTQKKPTLGSMFKASLVELMKTIESTNVHYIRCIKPNADKTAWGFDNLLVLSQLRACGILETIKISCAGFPSRWTFNEFIARFYFLSPMDVWRPIMNDDADNDQSKVEFSKNLLKELIDDDMKYQVGVTKVFFKAGILAYLEKIRTNKLAKVATVIQKKIRGLQYRREYMNTMKSIRYAQAISRGKMVRDFVDLQLKTKAAIFIQSIIRGYKELSHYNRIIDSTIRVQSFIRQRLAKLEVERIRREIAITKIQTKIRSSMVQKYHLRLKSSTLVLQRFVRKTLCQREYANMKREYYATNPEQVKLETSFNELMENIHTELEHDLEAIELLKKYEKDGMHGIIQTEGGVSESQNDLLSKKKHLENQITEIQLKINEYKDRRDHLIQGTKQFRTASSVTSNDINMNRLMTEMNEDISKLKGILGKSTNKNTNNKADMIGLGIIPPVHSSPKIGFDELHELNNMLNDLNIINQELRIILRNVSEKVLNEKSVSESNILAEITNAVLDLYFKVGKYNGANAFGKENVSAIFEVFSTFRRDELVLHGMFWISNIYNIFSHLANLRQTENGNRAAAIHKIEVEYKTLLSHCFDTWLKRVVQTITHQFIISRTILGSPTATLTPVGSSDENENIMKVIDYLETIYSNIDVYGFPSEVFNKIFSNIFASIDLNCCNDILNKRPNLSWKTGVVIDQNINNFMDWIESKGLVGFSKKDPFPLLKQFSKLLQLRISNVYDINFVLDICFSLNISQVHTVLKKYKPTEYEQPLPSEVLNYLTNQIKKNGRTKQTVSFSEDTKLLPSPFSVEASNSDSSIQEATVPAFFEMVNLEDMTPMVHKIVTMAILAATTNPQTPLPLNVFDVKIIQYKAALFKLKELQRLLGILEKNLKNDDRTKIIPLVNYILIICEEPTFNVSPILRKRFKLLCEHKLCKTNETASSISPQLIDLSLSLSDAIERDNYEYLYPHIYNAEQQWALLDCLKKISSNATVTYNKKLRQLLLEKNSSVHRPYEVSTLQDQQVNGVKFDFAKVEDILKPSELALSLDFAVLINDKEKDTSHKSFIKLQYQVLSKFISHMNKKVFPPLRIFYNKLQKYNNMMAKTGTTVSQTDILEIMPNYRFCLHRMYALLFRSFSLSCIISTMSKEIYLTNKEYFNEPSTKLLVKNLFDYEELITHLEKSCNNRTQNEFKDMLFLINEFSTNGIRYEKSNSSDTLTELYKENIYDVVHFVRAQLSSVMKLQENWKIITENLHMKSKFADMNPEQIEKMLDEKRSVDHLSHVEKMKAKQKTKAQKDQSSSSSSDVSSSRNISGSVTPLLNSLSLSNDDITPIDLKKQFYKTKHSSSSTSGSQMNLSGTKSPLSLSRRASMDKGSRTFALGMSPLSKTSSPRHINDLVAGSPGRNSPKISRRSSIITTARIPQNIIEKDGHLSPSRPEVGNTNKQIRKVMVRGRPRSTSLQSSFSNSNQMIPMDSSLRREKIGTIRSNSLEATAELNRQIIQNAAEKSMRKSNTSIQSAKTVKSQPLLRQNRSRSGSGSSQMISPDRQLSTPSKSNLGIPITSPLTRKKSNLSQEVTPDTIEENHDMPVRNEPEALQFLESKSMDAEVVKKVRFSGVPPMSADEDPKPKRRGWYKKPAQLHYPPIPPQVRILRNRLTQEGVAFRTSLRENYKDNTTETFENGLNETNASNRKTTMFLNSDGELHNPFKETIRSKFASKIRNSLRS